MFYSSSGSFQPPGSDDLFNAKRVSSTYVIVSHQAQLTWLCKTQLMSCPNTQCNPSIVVLSQGYVICI